MAETALIEAPGTPVSAVRQEYDLEGLTFAQRVALDPTIDLDRMNKIIAMEVESQKREAKKAFMRAKVAAKAELPRVLKGTDNVHTKSKYADLAAIDRAVTPILTKHGFTVEFDAVDGEKPNHINITCRTIHEEGHADAFTLSWPLDGAGLKGTSNKTTVQAMKSTITFARRTMKMMAFDISDSDDNDGNLPPPPSGNRLTEQQLTHLRKLLKDLGREETPFMEFVKAQGIEADTLEDVPFESYDTLAATLAGFIQKQAEGQPDDQ